MKKDEAVHYKKQYDNFKKNQTRKRKIQEILVIFESRILIGESLRLLFSHKKVFRNVHIAHNLNDPILIECAKEPVIYLISGTSYSQIRKSVQFITQYSSEATVVILDELFRCGSGYFLTPFQVHGYWTFYDSAEQIVQGLLNAVERQKSLSQHAEEFLSHSSKNGIKMTATLTDHPFYRLSKREEELFRLTAEGKDFEQCVEEMNITPKAIRNLRKRLLNKMNLSSERDIIWKAIEMGFIDNRTTKEEKDAIPWRSTELDVKR